MSRRVLATVIVVVAVAIVGSAAYVMAPRWLGPTKRPAAVAAAAPPPQVARKIKARLFYVSDDGMRLVGMERDVTFGEGVDQAREILAAQIAPVDDPLVSAVPAGTSLRSVFLTDKGEAFVDLSGAVMTAHTGGAMNELLTVYALVDALTVNLPAVHAVQILVDGKQVQTLAGHVDLRQPLEKNLSLVQ